MPAAWQALGTAAYMRDDYAAAAQAYRSAVAAVPNSADLYYGLGLSLYALDDYPGAEDAYRQATALAPDDPGALARAKACLNWDGSTKLLPSTSR